MSNLNYVIGDITPEYVLTEIQKGEASKEQLLVLIQNYGEQEFDKGSYTESGGYRDSYIQ